MGVNHGRFDILVSRKGLDFTDVNAVHEEMRGETVTQCVNGRLLRNARLLFSGYSGTGTEEG
jgi:hypothetical protein